MKCDNCNEEIEDTVEHFLGKNLCYDCCYEAITNAVDSLYFDKDWMNEYCGYGCEKGKISQGDLFSIFLFIIQKQRMLEGENEFLHEQFSQPLDDYFS